MSTPALSLTTDRRLRRRRFVNRLMEVLSTVAALLAVGVLVLMVGSVVQRGAPALSFDLLTKAAVPFGEAGGGLAPAFVGSAILVAVATMVALPLGVLIAIYVTELASPTVALIIRVTLDVINGLPSIVIGIFVFSALVAGHKQSGLAGSAALSIIMLPLVSRATQEMLLLVPSTLREAAYALGASKWRTILGVVLPTSLGGILTGTTLAVARAAGETAPLLFTSALAANSVTTDPREPLQSVTLSIFQLSESPDPADHARAWAAALVLIAVVLLLSVIARALLVRSRRKLAR